MKILFRIIGFILFGIFFAFALKNTQDTSLLFFLDYSIHAPLVIMLLGFFSAGAVMGILAMTPLLLRHRREINQQKKQLTLLQEEIAARTQIGKQPPLPDLM
jgi:uncharacterized integral membrane protein